MKPIRLSSSEWKLMEYLWDESPRTITQLVHALEPETDWAKATIITILSRLEAKGAVSWQTAGRARQYSPAVTREAASAAETRSFLDKVYHGSVGLLVNAMAEENALSAELTRDDGQPLEISVVFSVGEVAASGAASSNPFYKEWPIDQGATLTKGKLDGLAGEYGSQFGLHVLDGFSYYAFDSGTGWRYYELNDGSVLWGIGSGIHLALR